MRILNLIILLLFICLTCIADSWTQKSNFPGTGRTGPAHFVINGKAYFGTGNDAFPIYNYRKDFWQYDPASDVWTQMADFGGSPRYTSVAFSIGNKGFMGTGKSQSATVLFSDMWKYDQLNNIWNQVSNFPGVPRQSAIAFLVNNLIYTGFGRSSSGFLNDWYSYDENTDTWTTLTAFPGTARSGLGGFELNNKIYAGTGLLTYSPNYIPSNDFWEFDPTMNSWSQKANFPGLPRFSPVYFAINNKGYMGNGHIVSNGGAIITPYYDFYEYEPLGNLWTPKASIPANFKFQVGFAVNGKGYITCGDDSIHHFTSQCWEYSPDSTTGLQESTIVEFNIYPNPCTDFISFPLAKNSEVTIWDIHGKCLIRKTFLKTNNENPKLDVSFLPDGNYILMLDSRKYKFVKV